VINGITKYHCNTHNTNPPILCCATTMEGIACTYTGKHKILKRGETKFYCGMHNKIQINPFTRNRTNNKNYTNIRAKLFIKNHKNIKDFIFANNRFNYINN